ncbi:MAG: DUF499 domain-containing protein [Bacteroidetes bacterium]|nr:DUF499 domain-containing protein [Bacteroidota bacterium]
MKAFHTIATPHRDIQEGRFTLDIYAADLWEVLKGRAPKDYSDKDEFFTKTYFTDELNKLLDIVEKRLKSKGGDPVLHLKTPFGGGKTHTLIALYHKAKEWKAKPVVIVGEKLNTGSTLNDFETPWGMIEQQATGKLDKFKGYVPPGGEQIRNLLDAHGPVMILMDEMIPYLNKCELISRELDYNFTTVVIDFIKSLADEVSSIGNCSFVFTTTPSNPNDKTQRGMEIIQQLQDVTGRRDIARVPIKDEEVAMIIRRRLFSNIDEKEAKKVVRMFVDYAVKNSILPTDVESSEYKKSFEDSYPFMPEVIDALYHRWGSFPNFQRTRGVLRLLALVVSAVKDKNIPYISLADFDLSVPAIRNDLTKHIGDEYNTIIDQDISGVNSGASKVNHGSGDSYKGLQLGTRTATAIFMYSFSGGIERGITTQEAKRIATVYDHTASTITDILDSLNKKLFYMRYEAGKYYYTNEPNLNMILITKMENIKEGKVSENLENLFRSNLANTKLKTYFSFNSTGDIPDGEGFKLVIFHDKKNAQLKEYLEKKGSTPRVNRNTVFFLTPISTEKYKLENLIKEYLAWENISHDNTIKLSLTQMRQVENSLNDTRQKLPGSVRNAYRVVQIPDKTGFVEFDIGIQTSSRTKLDDEIYEHLISDKKILSKISPIALNTKYLTKNDYVEIDNIYRTSLSTVGEIRYASEIVLHNSIQEGVKEGIFGLGRLDGDKPVCKHFEVHIPELIYGDQIIIKGDICRKQIEENKPTVNIDEGGPRGEHSPDVKDGGEDTSVEGEDKGEETEGTPTETFKKTVSLSFDLPHGKSSDIARMLNLLQHHYKSLKLDISASDGQMSEQDYENKIQETLRQLGIEK